MMSVWFQLINITMPLPQALYTTYRNGWIVGEVGLGASNSVLLATKSLIDTDWLLVHWRVVVPQIYSSTFSNIIYNRWIGWREVLTQLEPWEAEHSLGIQLATPAGNMMGKFKYHFKWVKLWASNDLKWSQHAIWTGLIVIHSFYKIRISIHGKNFCLVTVQCHYEAGLESRL